MLARRVVSCLALCAIALVLPQRAAAQVAEVALVVTGPDAESAASAFESFVSIRPELRFSEAPEAPPDLATELVSIDTATPAVRVWRRRDGAVLERRFGAPEDAYALAVVGSELLEVARSGADPSSVGATVVVEPVVVEDPAPLPVEPEVEPEEVVEAAPEVVEPVELDEEERAWLVAFTPGIALEGWFSIDGDPWQVQPALFVELLAGPADEAWRVGGAIFASGLGSAPFERGGFEGSYARYDLGARLTFGGDLGPVRTRLLGHVRVGGAPVVVSAQPAGENDERAEAVLGSWFVGAGIDLRQPIVEGLEAFLDLSVDFLPAPLRVTGLGAALVREPVVRPGGRLGLAWRFR